jgi:hypothetical protein
LIIVLMTKCSVAKDTCAKKDSHPGDFSLYDVT